MVILCVTVVPIFHRLGVYTAYEYLEKRFDTKTRVLTTLIFLVSRGLAAGITIYAPSLLLSVMLDVNIQVTSRIIGGIVIIYTTSGGVKAVNYSDFLQLIIVMAGMCIAFGMALSLLPKEVSFTDALSISAIMGKLNAIDLSLDFSNRYNVWSGIFGGMFVALAYFGTDQSQVQRYLTGQSVAQSRLGLLFNGMAKVPMQVFILFIGVMVFVFFQFVQPPLIFNPVEAGKVKSGEQAQVFHQLEEKHNSIFLEKSKAIHEYLNAKHQHNERAIQEKKAGLQQIQQRYDAVRKEASNLSATHESESNSGDTNYIFLTFVLTYLPAGLVGLIFACIFTASMSSSSGELSALATISIIDIYKRFIKRGASEKHYLMVSRIMMAFWGLYGILFAQYAGKMGSLVEAVNILGSLFYGTMLGIFVLAFSFKSVKGTSVFIGALAGEAVVFYCFQFTSIAWLWYNVIGCFVVVAVGIILSAFETKRSNHSLTSS
jgi:Na+/proline symporter